MDHHLRVLDALLKVDGRRDGSDDGELIGITIGKTKCTLAAHARSQQSNARRFCFEAAGDGRHDTFEYMLLGRRIRIKLGTDTI